ncbi:hypothetical protein BDV18DRAFT_161323 [Aspergillus unguis]
MAGHKIHVSIAPMVEIVFFWVKVSKSAGCEQTTPCRGSAADVAEEWKFWSLHESDCCCAEFDVGEWKRHFERPPAQVDPTGPPVSIQPNTPNDRLFEALGSNDYPYPFSLVEKQINSAKGRLMGGSAPTGLKEVRNASETAPKSGSDEDINRMLQSARVGISIFDYLNDENVSRRFNAAWAQVRQQAAYIEEDVPELPDLAARWVEFFNDFLQARQELAQNWLRGAVFEALEPWLEAYENRQG